MDRWPNKNILRMDAWSDQDTADIGSACCAVQNETRQQAGCSQATNTLGLAVFLGTRLVRVRCLTDHTTL
jgi:hypothetical protein